MIRNIWIVLFSVFALYYIFFADSNGSAYMVFKLIPMLVLIIMALSTKVQSAKNYKLFICIGLIFCAFGDYTLQWFIVGLSCFLLGHIFYILAFYNSSERRIPLLAIIILFLYGLGMIIWIGGSLLQNDELVLAIAVTVYIGVILTMGLSSFKTGTLTAVFGAMLFIISDSVLAINRFMFDVAFSHEIIMLTYYGAQFLLTLSIIKYDELQQKVVQ